MSRRISSVIFIVALIVITSSLFYFYVDLNRKVEQIPLKYDALQQEYSIEEDRVLEINKKIYQDVVSEYESLGGNTSDLSRFDTLRFLRDSETSSELLNSIEHEQLTTTAISEPPTGQYRETLEYEEELELRSNFKFISVIHAYAALMALAVYIVMMLLSKKKIITKDS